MSAFVRTAPDVGKIGQLLILLAAFSLTGCSGVKTYPDTFEKNIRVRTRIDSGSAFSNTVAEFDIHRVRANCETEYQGRVYLDKPMVETGIPVGQRSYLDFIFASKGVLSSNISATRYKTVLTPRAGYLYDVRVSYDQGIYNVVIREQRRGTPSGRIIERKDVSACGK